MGGTVDVREIAERIISTLRFEAECTQQRAQGVKMLYEALVAAQEQIDGVGPDSSKSEQ